MTFSLTYEIRLIESKEFYIQKMRNYFYIKCLLKKSHFAHA